MTPNPYTNDHSRLLDRLSQQADAISRSAAQWLKQLASAKADAVTAEEAFLADFSPTNARVLAEAQNKVRDLTTVASAIEANGGPDEARVRTLRTNAVFAAFATGFAERSKTLEKLVPIARQRLAAARAALTEAGTPSGIIESHPTVLAAWREEHTASYAIRFMPPVDN